MDLIFGVAGAVLSLLGVVAGNLLVLAALLAQKYSMSIPELLVQMLDNLDTSAELLNDSFFPFGALSYAIALYFGFTLSYRHERYERPDDWTGGIGH